MAVARCRFTHLAEGDLVLFERANVFDHLGDRLIADRRVANLAGVTEPVELREVDQVGILAVGVEFLPPRRLGLRAFGSDSTHPDDPFSDAPNAFVCHIEELYGRGVKYKSAAGKTNHSPTSKDGFPDRRDRPGPLCFEQLQRRRDLGFVFPDPRRLFVHLQFPLFGGFDPEILGGVGLAVDRHATVDLPAVGALDRRDDQEPFDPLFDRRVDVDRFSERRVMIAGTIVVSIAILFVVTAPSAAVLFGATALIGLGLSLYPIARITALSVLYPDRLGSALGVTMATGDLGQTVLPPIAGTLAIVFVWQAGLGFLVPLLLLAGIGLWVTLPSDSGTDSGSSGTSMETIRTVGSELRQSGILFMVFILFLYILIWQSFTGFYPTYLIEIKGLSTSVASLLFSFYFAVGVLVKPVAGAIYDRIGVKGSLAAVLVGPLVGFALLPRLDSLLALIVVTALVSTMLGSGAITQSFLAERLSEEIRGTGLGAIRTTSATLGAAGPLLFGYVADLGYFDEGYYLLSGLMLGVLLLTLRMPGR